VVQGGRAKGKSFACYGAESEKVGPNEYRAVDGAAFNMTLMDQAALLEDPRFERTPYIGQHGWVTMRWDGEPDWAEVRQLAESAYRKVAGKRLLEELDGGKAQSPAVKPKGKPTARAGASPKEH